MNHRQSFFAVLTFMTLLATMITHQFGSRRYQKVTEARLKADNTREALMNLRICLTDAETGYRGYLLADNAWYKETYLKALSRYPVVLDELEAIYSRKSVAELVRLSNLRMELIRHSVSLFDRGLKDEAVDLMKAGDGKRVMDDFRDEVTRLKKESIVQEQDLQLEFQTASAWLLNGLGLMHLIVLVLIAIAMIPESGLKELIKKEIK